MSRFEVGWISQASAAQRAGRAGRTGPGHAYRLYSSAVFSRFPAFDEPEVTRTPTPTLVLALKGVGVSSVAGFPFPSPPPPGALLSGIRSLVSLGALETHLRAGAGGGGAAPSLAAIESEELTPLGEALARLPVAPPLGKILVLAAQAQKAALATATDDDDDDALARSRLADYASHLVAVMATDNLLVLPSLPRTADESARPRTDGGESGESDDEGARGDALLAAVEAEADAAEAAHANGASSKEAAAADAADAAAAAAAAAALASARAAHARLRHPLSDALTRLRALGAYAFTARGAPRTRLCKDWALRAKGMSEALALAGQLRDAVRVVVGDVPVCAVGDEEGGGRWAMSVDNEGGDDACADGASVTASEGEGDGGGAVILAGAKVAAERVLTGGSLDAAEASTPTAGVDAESGPLSLPPPSAVIETLLRQVLLGGLIGHVARRARPEETAAACAAAGIPNGRGVPYVPASASLREGIAAGVAAARAANAESDAAAAGGRVGDAAAPPASASAQHVVWIHPQSSVSDSDAALAPAFIVFENVRFGKSARAWAVGVTAVEESWISSLARGTPLLVMGKHVPTPAPSYAPTSDAIVATFTPLFGDAQWRLPPVRAALDGDDARSCDARVRAFARALLEGTAVAALARVVCAADALRSPASTLSRSDVPAPLARTGNLLRALTAPDKVIPPRAAAVLGDDAQTPVDSARALARVWHIAPGFLYDEIAAWCRDDAVADLKRTWPAVVRAFLSQFGGGQRADVVVVDAAGGRAERRKA